MTARRRNSTSIGITTGSGITTDEKEAHEIVALIAHSDELIAGVTLGRLCAGEIVTPGVVLCMPAQRALQGRVLPN